MADLWDSNDTLWNSDADQGYAKIKPVYLNGQRFNEADVPRGEDGVGLVTASVERIGLPLSEGRVNPSTIKLLTGCWPIIYGTVGDVIQIYLGVQYHTPTDEVTWRGPYNWTIGVSEYVDTAISGRFAAIRFYGEATNPWEVVSYALDFEVVGEH